MQRRGKEGQTRERQEPDIKEGKKGRQGRDKNPTYQRERRADKGETRTRYKRGRV